MKFIAAALNIATTSPSVSAQQATASLDAAPAGRLQL
jgi:hypothetical protein